MAAGAAVAQRHGLISAEHLFDSDVVFGPAARAQVRDAHFFSLARRESEKFTRRHVVLGSQFRGEHY